MLKSELRQQMRELKRQFTQQQLDELSLSVILRLKPLLAEAHTVLAFYSLPDEVNTHQLVDDLVAEGKTLLLPKVLDDATMELRRYTGQSDLEEGAFHIMEPIGEPFTDYDKIDVALIPGMAFDAAGHRLGRGKGYYDRFLASHLSPLAPCPSPLKIGICFPFQRVPKVPSEEHDILMDILA